jgi:hypothetical protein
MNRREFLAAGSACAAAPLLLGMTRKANAKHPTVGEKDHVYECHHGWGTLPGELEWQTTHGTAVDSQGLVYITHQGGGAKKIDTVIIFDAAGKFIRSFGSQWHGGGHGIDIRKEGSDEFIYLTHMSNDGPVVKTTLKGEVIWKLGRPDNDEYKKTIKDKKTDKEVRVAYKPTNVAFSPNGEFYVADGYGSGYILCYTADGKLKNTFGGGGTENGKFRTPHGLWVCSQRGGGSRLVVCDRANARLQTFELDGTHVHTTEKDVVYFPANIDFQKGIMLVPDLHARIGLYDSAKNEWVAQLGNDDAWRMKVTGKGDYKGPAVRTQPKLWEAGKFVHPHDACFDAAGNIYCAEWVQGGRLTFLRKV